MDRQALIYAFAGIIFLIMLLVVFIIRQQRQIQYLSQPRYGFLGKSLSAAVVTIIMGVSIVGGVHVLNQRSELSFQAKADLDLQISMTKKLISSSGTSVTYQFSAIPKVKVNTNSGIQDVEPNSKWNVYWNFTKLGSTQPTLSRSEVSLSSSKPSNLQVALQKGTTYNVYITLEYIGSKTVVKAYNETVKV